MDHVQVVTLFLLLLTAAGAGLARVLDVPYPILLVVGGTAVGFVPGMPSFELDPELVLYVLLPPLLYASAYSSSWRDLRRHARVIGLNAFGLVVATTVVVAVAAHALVDGLPWAAAFALGAVVSPTDPLAATQITQRLGVPRRTTVVIEGESLINDGSALVIYRTAVAAVGGTAFVWWHAAGDFVLAVVVGVLVGLVVGYVVGRVSRTAREDAFLTVVLSLSAGYVAYIPAEQLHGSGVIAAVTAGLVMGHQAPTTSTADGRLRSTAFWEVLVFLVNAVLFASVGLEVPHVLDQQSRGFGTLLAIGLAVAVVVVLTRFAWSHVMTAVLRTLDRRPSQRERRASWQLRTVNIWCGLRGAVSLAAALALPVDFPERDLLVFATLCVVWVTLVGQGLTLPLLIRLLGVTDDGVSSREELHARKVATRAALDEIERLGGEDWTRPDTMERLQGMYEFRQRRLLQRAGRAEEGAEDAEARSQDYQRIVRTVLDAQRDALVRLRREGAIGNDALVTVERELDLEEERLDS